MEEINSNYSLIGSKDKASVIDDLKRMSEGIKNATELDKQWLANQMEIIQENGLNKMFDNMLKEFEPKKFDYDNNIMNSLSLPMLKGVAYVRNVVL